MWGCRRNSLSLAATITTVRGWFIFPVCPAMTHFDRNDARRGGARAKQSRGWPAQVRSGPGISRNRYGPPGGRVSETRLAG